MIDTLPKHGNELPNTDEPERMAATLIVEPIWLRGRGIQPRIVGSTTHLKPVWMVDFYRGRPEGPR